MCWYRNKRNNFIIKAQFHFSLLITQIVEILLVSWPLQRAKEATPVLTLGIARQVPPDIYTVDSVMGWKTLKGYPKSTQLKQRKLQFLKPSKHSCLKTSHSPSPSVITELSCNLLGQSKPFLTTSSLSAFPLILLITVTYFYINKWNEARSAFCLRGQVALLPDHIRTA